MESIRQRQTAETIRRHIGTVFQKEGSYIYGGAFVTVTKVYVSPDISISKIYLSVYNTKDKAGVIQKINDNMHLIKKNLAFRIKKHVRRVPNIMFYIDDMVDEMYKVDSLLNNLRSRGQMGEEE